MLDVVWRLGIVEMDGGKTQGVKESVDRATAIAGEVLEYHDTVLDFDGRTLGEGSGRVEVVEEDDRARHAPQAEHVGLVVFELLLLDHVHADVGHGRERESHVVALHALVLREELDRGLVDDVHHRRRIREEERHSVGELVADADVEVLLGQLHAVKRSAVI